MSIIIEKLFDELIAELERIWKTDLRFDYDKFESFTRRFTIGVENSYPLNNEAASQFAPYTQILHFSVAYNHFTYNKLCNLLTKKEQKLYSYKENSERNPLTDVFVLQLWRQKNLALDNLARSFCTGREYQALQQLRGYIESSQVLFLILTDYEILNLFLNDQGLNEEEYRKQWWKHLAPSKITKRIKANKQKVLDDEKERGIITPDIRKHEPGNNLDFFSNLVDGCSNYLHWNKDALFSHSYEKSKNGFRVSGNYDWSNHSKTSLVNIIESVSEATKWVEDALGCHIILFDHHAEEDYDGQILQFIHSGLALKATYRGMYDFAKNT